MATNKETTAVVAAKQASGAAHENESVTVSNSGDPVTGTIGGGVAETPATVLDDSLEKPANIAPATEVDPSGAPVQIVPDVDLSHPAVDNDPRKGTTVAQNKIDFNDPSLSSGEAVAKMLRAQGVEIISDPSSK